MRLPPHALHSPVGGRRAALSRVIRLPSRRTAIGLAAVILCASVLGWRVRTIAREQRVPVSPRVTQLMYNRMLARWIQAYARTYRRPAYYLDSVLAHLDSAERRVVSNLLTDLWGDRVYYVWTYCDFTLASHAGARPWLRPPPPDTVAPVKPARWGPEPPQGELREEYPWPPGVGRTDKCLGGS
jgi:hypothetical protein